MFIPRTIQSIAFRISGRQGCILICQNYKVRYISLGYACLQIFQSGRKKLTEIKLAIFCFVCLSEHLDILQLLQRKRVIIATFWQTSFKMSFLSGPSWSRRGEKGWTYMYDRSVYMYSIHVLQKSRKKRHKVHNVDWFHVLYQICKRNTTRTCISFLIKVNQIKIKIHCSLHIHVMVHVYIRT